MKKYYTEEEAIKLADQEIREKVDELIAAGAEYEVWNKLSCDYYWNYLEYQEKKEKEEYQIEKLSRVESRMVEDALWEAFDFPYEQDDEAWELYRILAKYYNWLC